MTIGEALQKIDTLKQNTYTPTEKISWLSNLDHIVKLEIFDLYEGHSEEPFEPYDENTPLTKELMIPAPYDDVYLYWLESRIDYYNAEYAKYNNSITSFNNAYATFSRYYNRNYMPLGQKIRYF